MLFFQLCYLSLLNYHFLKFIWFPCHTVICSILLLNKQRCYVNKDIHNSDNLKFLHIALARKMKSNYNECVKSIND